MTTDINTLPILDRAVLDPLCEVLEDDAPAVLDEFISDAPSLCTQIKSALQAEDFPTVAGLLHQLKSSSGAVGGARVQNVAMYAEGQALAGSSEEIMASCKMLFAAIEELIVEIKGYRQSL